MNVDAEDSYVRRYYLDSTTHQMKGRDNMNIITEPSTL